MAREGTRSATGNSKPRIFQTIDTQPAVKRTTKPKKTPTTATTTTKEPITAKIKGAKPAGVSKPAKKESVGAKVKATASKVAAKVKGEEAKTKKATKPKAAAAVTK
ncbi:hypothetical protein PFICI_10391 [Pestalotiopsis fici W106-1]|uniref:Uncharacterized protein n=1 Tax=Pestalotiopsis fici (strain W106-1 / CGMCC3.15140) TaxID=1229662 RepID=W3WX10_PESFW|nr:uncharacterized protein PFICI_10391 [Pestalotiopsis fici W106-1]ETS78329.1 hypothetical protein PFICI_10391 [Pestalotiopsis fici W106-1]